MGEGGGGRSTKASEKVATAKHARKQFIKKQTEWFDLQATRKTMKMKFFSLPSTNHRADDGGLESIVYFVKIEFMPSLGCIIVNRRESSDGGGKPTTHALSHLIHIEL